MVESNYTSRFFIHEQVQAITTLRSGRVVDNKVKLPPSEKRDLVQPHGCPLPILKSIPTPLKENDPVKKDIPSSSSPSPLEKSYEPRVPFHQPLKDSSPFGRQQGKIHDMMEVFKQVKINIPLLDAIHQIPPYAKFMKDLCTQKRKSRSQAPKNNTPQKFKDPAISSLHQKFFNLPIGLKKQPRGIIEDILIKVDKFCFPVDFVVLETKLVPNPINHIPIILGRPFLATVNATINYESGIMDISFGNMMVKLNVFNASQHLIDEGECFLVDVLDDLV
ncbi:uncharacterized protein LOC132305002 [Cornus florida]|uniref:uncharacterized protein LOC132305002 n=1 Tax=Cornus florida TaxID=4283 RepID=UPI0028A1410E|nr:uncharacterized protein LOC132305002 [Cornus florida]